MRTLIVIVASVVCLLIVFVQEGAADEPQCLWNATVSITTPPPDPLCAWAQAWTDVPSEVESCVDFKCTGTSCTDPRCRTLGSTAQCHPSSPFHDPIYGGGRDWAHAYAKAQKTSTGWQFEACTTSVKTTDWAASIAYARGNNQVKKMGDLLGTGGYLEHDGLGGDALDDPTESIGVMEITDLGERQYQGYLKGMLPTEEVKALELSGITFVPEGKYERFLRVVLHVDAEGEPRFSVEPTGPDLLPDCPKRLDPKAQRYSCITIVRAPKGKDSWADVCDPSRGAAYLESRGCRKGERRRFATTGLRIEFFWANLVDKHEGETANVTLSHLTCARGYRDQDKESEKPFRLCKALRTK